MLRFVVFMVCLAIVAASTRYPENTPLGHTGGFDEPTCLACHFDGELNAPGGSLTIAGVDEKLVAGQSYEISVTLQRKEMAKSGIQLSVRHPDGGQAGQLRSSNAALRVDTLAGVQYARHSLAGTVPLNGDSTVWHLTWTAPRDQSEAIFHVAANAANGDVSEFGDFIYTLSRSVVVHEDD